MKNKSAILSGAGSFWIGDADSEMPEIDDNGQVVFDSTSGWVDVGFTDGVSIEVESEFQEIFADQHLAVLKLLLTKEAAKVVCSIHQRDVDTFNLAISASSKLVTAAGADQPGMNLLSIGDGTPVEKKVAFVGTSPNGFARMWYAPIAVATGTIKYEGKKEHTPLEVEFMCCADPSAPAGSRLLQCYDITATPTA